MDVSNQFIYINEIINNNIFNVNWNQYVNEEIFISNIKEWKNVYEIIKKNKEIGISYRYHDNSFFMISIFSDNTAYILSDQSTLTSQDIINIVLLLCSNHIVYVWNIKHFIKPFINTLNNDNIKELYKHLIDVQILSYITTLQKEGGLKNGQYIDSEYHKKVQVFIDKVYKNDTAYYYIPRNILGKAMLQETVAAYFCGKLLSTISTKLNMTRLQYRLQLFSFFLSDLENETVTIAQTSFAKLLESGLTFKRETIKLMEYCKNFRTNKLPLEYRHLSSTTGRLTFGGNSGVNLLSYPKDDTRSLIVPENDMFISVDAKGMEIFYILKKRTRLFSNLDMSNDFDIYQYILDRIEQKVSRSKLKSFVIKWFYGASNFDEEEERIRQEISSKIPEIVPESHFRLPIYYQTDFGRIIKINESYTKFQNNIPQSEANDLMLECVFKIWSIMKYLKMKSKIKLLIHDQFIIDATTGERDAIIRIIQRTLDGQFPYRYSIGKNWKEVS